MTAHDQIRAMLDELMGTSRDADNMWLVKKLPVDGEKQSWEGIYQGRGKPSRREVQDDRMDLGECPSVHDLAFRADYETAALNKDYFYDIDAMEHLQSFISDCDRKTEVAKRRLKETQEELSEEANSKAEQIHALGEQIGTLMAKAEEVGASGQVDESMKMLEQVEALKFKKTQSEIELRDSMPASSYQQQKLRVCEVCGAYLGIHDNDRRLADHFGGKLHLGFITIREKLDQLKTLVTERRSLRETQREEMRQRREKEVETERSKNQPTSDRSPSRSKSNYEQGDTERSERDRSRDRTRHRSRSQDRHKHKRRSRSRDHNSRKRSKRSRSRSRRSRSGSRESHHHSRSHSHSRRSKHRRRSGSRSRNDRSRSRSGERKDVNGATQTTTAAANAESD